MGVLLVYGVGFLFEQVIHTYMLHALSQHHLMEYLSSRLANEPVQRKHLSPTLSNV